MSHENQPPDIEPAAVDTLTFEQALAQLETIVTTLERGDAPLNQALSYYERGEKLKRHCENLLKAVEAKVEQIKKPLQPESVEVETLDLED